MLKHMATSITRMWGCWRRPTLNLTSFCQPGKALRTQINRKLDSSLPALLLSMTVMTKVSVVVMT